MDLHEVTEHDADHRRRSCHESDDSGNDSESSRSSRDRKLGHNPKKKDKKSKKHKKEKKSKNEKKRRRDSDDDDDDQVDGRDDKGSKRSAAALDTTENVGALGLAEVSPGSVAVSNIDNKRIGGSVGTGIEVVVSKSAFFANLLSQEMKKPATGTVHAVGKKDPIASISQAIKPGDWTCQKCSANNMKEALQCSKCRAMKRLSTYR